MNINLHLWRDVLCLNLNHNGRQLSGELPPSRQFLIMLPIFACKVKYHRLQACKHYSSNTNMRHLSRVDLILVKIILLLLLYYNIRRYHEGARLFLYLSSMYRKKRY